MGRSDNALAMQVEVRGHAFKGARTVEYDRRQPHAVAHGTDDARIAFEPLAFEKSKRASGHELISTHIRERCGAGLPRLTEPAIDREAYPAPAPEPMGRPETLF